MNFPAKLLRCSNTGQATVWTVTNTFAYNLRSEITNAVFDAYASAYSYDTIGNRVWSVENAVTNTYSANNLNQYAGLSYDADGNLLSDGEHTFSCRVKGVVI